MCHNFRCAQRVVLCLGMLLMVATTMCAQEASAIPASPTPQIGLPQDWSTQRVIYTRNGSVDDMMKARSDPRFLNSFLLHYRREHANQAGLAINGQGNERSADTDTPESLPEASLRHPVNPPIGPRRNRHTKVDWAVPLGATYGMAIGETPALYMVNANGTPACTSGSTVGDFLVLSLKAPATVGSQANLVGLTNLYSGTSPTGICGTTPTFLFSYAIGNGRSFLSPVISLDGKKIAWIETTTALNAVLHVTTWVQNQGTNATTGAVAIGTGGSSDVAIDYTTATYPGCTATTNPNTNSEIYVDFSSDTAFVGADNGILYHIKGIFKGTPTFDFCITVNNTAGTALGGGVYDSLLSPPVFFIADSKKLYAYQVGATSFTLQTSVTYGIGTLTGPGPVLDAFNNFIYVFSAQDAEATSHASVTQFPTSLASSVVVPLGLASTEAYPILFYGAFDNNYFNFGPKNAASTLYSCGTDGARTSAQDLFAISFNAATGIVNTTPAMSANKNVNPGGAAGICSPIAEFYDGTHDRIFVGMGEHLATSGANVVTMWNVDSRPTASATPTASTARTYLGGSSGIVVDNSSAAAQAASIYFTTLAANGTNPGTCGASQYCAVKLTQGALQ